VLRLNTNNPDPDLKYLDLALKLSSAGDSIDPHYYDVFGKAEYDLGRAGRMSVHVLDAGDALRYLDTPDPSIRSRYRSTYGWLNWEGRFGPLRQRTVASLGRLTWRRDGDRVDDGALTALVADRRSLAGGAPWQVGGKRVARA